VSFEIVLSATKVLEGGDKVSFLQTEVFCRVEATHKSLQINPLSLNFQHLAYIFPVKIDLCFKGILPATHALQVRDRICLHQIELFS
jgi:hypothetical protein